jgi:hypothetical protein
MVWLECLCFCWQAQRTAGAEPARAGTGHWHRCGVPRNGSAHGRGKQDDRSGVSSGRRSERRGVPCASACSFRRRGRGGSGRGGQRHVAWDRFPAEKLFWARLAAVSRVGAAVEGRHKVPAAPGGIIASGAKESDVTRDCSRAIAADNAPARCGWWLPLRFGALAPPYGRRM